MPRDFSRSRFVLGVIASGLLSACDGITPVETEQTKVVDPAADIQVAPAVGGEFHDIGRFQVAATINGSLRPGGTVQVTAAVRANFETKGAQIRVYAPEVAL